MKQAETVYINLPKLPDVKEIVIDGVLFVNLSAALPASKNVEAPRSLQE